MFIFQANNNLPRHILSRIAASRITGFLMQLNRSNLNPGLICHRAVETQKGHSRPVWLSAF